MANLGSAYGEIIIDASGVKTGVAQARSELQKFSDTARKIGAPLAALGGSMLAFAGTSVKAAISLESAFTGVIKTTDGLVDATGSMTKAGAELYEGLRQLSHEVPATVEELMAIGEIGGQLGVGQEALLGFTETVAALSETTNLTAEGAATALAQISNIFDIATADMGDNVERMGSALVALGNNFATTESDILNFAQRIAGAGRIAGLTQADIMAIGAAMSSVGVQAEAGGTAVQKVLLGIHEAVMTADDSLAVFAETAGMTAEEFSTLWEEDASEAFRLFVEGLGSAGDEAINILEDLDLTDQRLIRSFLSLSNAGDLLGETLEMSSQAWEENTALAREAGLRYDTTASNLAEFQNTAKDAAAGLGEFLLPALNDIVATGKDLVEQFDALPAPLRKTIAEFTVLGGGITAVGGAAMVAGPYIAGFVASIAALVPAIAAGAGLLAIGLYIKNIGEASRDAAAEVLSSTSSYEQYTLELKAAGLESQTFSESLYDQAKAMQAAGEAIDLVALQDAREALQADLDIIIQMNEATPEFTNTVKTVGQAVEMSTGQIQMMVKDMSDLQLLVAGNREEMTQYALALGLDAEQAGAFAAQLAELVHQEQIMRTLREAAVTSIGDHEERMLGLVDVTAQVTEATEAQAEVTGMAAGEMASLAEQTGLSVQQVRALVEAMGLSGEQVIAYASAVQQAAGMIGGFVETLTGGLGALREMEAGTADYQQQMLGLSLTIAEQTGLLQAWAATEFGPDLAQFADEADEVLGLINQGVIEMDGSLAELVQNMAQGVQDALGETASQAEENQRIISNMMTGLEDAAADTAEELQKKLDLKELLPYEDAVAAGVAVGQGIQEGIPEDPFGALLAGFSGAAESIARESGLIVDSLAEIPTEVDIAASLSGVPAVLNLAEEVQEALAAIPTDIGINIHATYSGEEGAEWTESIALEQALRDVVTLANENFPIDIGIIGFEEVPTLLGGIKDDLVVVVSWGEQMGQAFVGAAADLETLLDVAGDLSGLGSAFARMFERETLDPMEAQLKAIDEAIAELERLGSDDLRTQYELRALYADRAALAQRITAEEQRLLELQEAQQNLDFLKQQYDLMQLVLEQGLDAKEILGGIQWGLGASEADLVEAMTAAMQAMITAAEEELQIGSPSRVMMDMMRQAMAGAALGARQFAELPAMAMSESMAAVAREAASGLVDRSGLFGGAVSGYNDGYRTKERRGVRDVTINLAEGSADPYAMAEYTASRIRNAERYGA